MIQGINKFTQLISLPVTSIHLVLYNQKLVPMPYVPFHFICPETATSETRVITLQHLHNPFGLPPGDYAFIELYCDECDCRRAVLQVILNRNVVATIAYGWDKLSFYRKEFSCLDEASIKEFKGPALVSFQHQSELSARVLTLFDTVLFSDKAYLKRLEKHYNHFKETLKNTNIHYT